MQAYSFYLLSRFGEYEICFDFDSEVDNNRRNLEVKVFFVTLAYARKGSLLLELKWVENHMVFY